MRISLKIIKDGGCNKVKNKIPYFEQFKTAIQLQNVHSWNNEKFLALQLLPDIQEVYGFCF